MLNRTLKPQLTLLHDNANAPTTPWLHPSPPPIALWRVSLYNAINIMRNVLYVLNGFTSLFSTTVTFDSLTVVMTRITDSLEWQGTVFIHFLQKMKRRHLLGEGAFFWATQSLLVAEVLLKKKREYCLLKTSYMPDTFQSEITTIIAIIKNNNS